LELFAAKSFDGVTIADIAVAAGVSQGALYRHYASKDELAWTLFSTAYLRTGEELEEIRSRGAGLEGGVAAMIAHFCALYDEHPALFRFMLLTQHGFLPRIDRGSRTPVDAVTALVGDAAIQMDLRSVDPAMGAAMIMGVVLQSATFHIYGRLSGALSDHAPALTRAAIAAVKALAE
jgi:AcrR family transcriptional regulator